MATIQEQLKLKIEELKKLKDVSPIPLRGKIILAYRQKVLAGILAIIEKSGDDEQKLYAELQIFLGENWKKYGLSPVGYTALPDDPITEFLCDIAVEIAKPLSNPIDILMPGVQTQVTVDSEVYPDLDRLSLKQVIKTHIINRNGRYLLPVKFLTQVTISSIEANICNHYYDGLSDDPELRDGALAYLDAEEKYRLFHHSFETLSIIEAKQQFDTLTNDNCNLLNQLNTLILNLRAHSKQGLGTPGAAGEGVYILILNFQEFYGKLTLEQKDTIPPLVREQIDLLWNIGDKTAARYSKAFVEENAAPPVAVGNAEGENPGPQPMVLAPPPTVTTCIYNREKDFSKAMKGHEAILARITLNAESKDELIKNITATLAEMQKVLLEKIEQFAVYRGADRLKIPEIQFLHDLSIDFKIDSIEELTLLTVADFQILCSNKNYRNKIVAAFNRGSVHDLSGFFLLSNEDMLRAVLSELAKELFITVMDRKPELMGMFLNLLNNERFEIASMAMSGYFKAILYGDYPHDQDYPEPRWFFERLSTALDAGRGYRLVSKTIDAARQASFSQLDSFFKWLPKELFNKIFAANRAHLPSLLQSWNDLKLLHKWMSVDEFAQFVEANMKYLSLLLQSWDDLKWLHQYISAPIFAKFVEVNRAHLSELLQSWDDLKCLHEWKCADVFIEFVEANMEYLSLLLQSWYDLKWLHQYISARIFAKFIETNVAHLSGVLKSWSDLQWLHKRIPPEMFAKFVETNMMHLSGVLKSWNDLKWLYKCISPEMFSKFVEVNRAHLSGLLQSWYDLKCLHKWMPVDVFAKFVEANVADWSNLLKLFSDLDDLHEWMPKDLFNKIVEANRAHLPSLLKSWDHLKCLHEWMSPGVFAEFVEINIENLSNLLKLFYDLDLLHKWMPQELLAKIVEANMARLPVLMRTTNDLVRLHEWIPQELFLKTVEAHMARSPSILELTDSLTFLRDQLPENLFAEIVEVSMAHFSSLLTSFDDLKHLHEWMPEDIWAKFIENNIALLPGLLKSLDDLECLYGWMSEDVFAKFIENNIARLPDLLKLFYDLARLYEWMSLDVFTGFVEADMAPLPSLLKSLNALGPLYEWVYADMFAEFVEVNKADLFSLLRSFSALKCLYESMYEDVFLDFFKDNRARLPGLLRTFDDLEFLYTWLYADMFAEFVEANIVHLSGLLKSFNDLERLYEWGLSADLFERILKANMARLPGLLRSLNDLGHLHEWMSSNMFLCFVEDNIDHIPILLKSFNDLEHLHEWIPEDLFIEVMITLIMSPDCSIEELYELRNLLMSPGEGCKKETEVRNVFSKIMKDARESLSDGEEYVTYNLYAVSTMLPEIIYSPRVFSEWMNPNNDQDVYSAERVLFNEQHKTIIFKAMKRALIAMLEKSPYENTLQHIIQYLNDEQRAEFFSDLLSCDNGQLLWIRTASNFYSLAEALKGNGGIFQRIAAQMIKTGKLAKCISSYNDICFIDQILTPDQMKELEKQWMRDFLPIYNARLSFFSSSQSVRWSEEIKKREVKIKDVFCYAMHKPSSRTADAVSEMRERRDVQLKS